MAITRDAAGNISREIRTSIQGTGTVSLHPLLDRQHQLEEIETQQAALIDLINELPRSRGSRPLSSAGSEASRPLIDIRGRRNAQYRIDLVSNCKSVKC
jgi:hypothetical protein